MTFWRKQNHAHCITLKTFPSFALNIYNFSRRVSKHIKLTQFTQCIFSEFYNVNNLQWNNQQNEYRCDWMKLFVSYPKFGIDWLHHCVLLYQNSLSSTHLVSNCHFQSKSPKAEKKAIYTKFFKNTISLRSLNGGYKFTPHLHKYCMKTEIQINLH